MKSYWTIVSTTTTSANSTGPTMPATAAPLIVKTRSGYSLRQPPPLSWGPCHEPRERRDPRERASEPRCEPECDELPRLACQPEEQARRRHQDEPSDRRG